MLINKVELKNDAKLTITEIRMLVGCTQKEFAKKVSIPYSTYVKKESGKTKFLISEVGNICKETNIPIYNIDI